MEQIQLSLRDGTILKYGGTGGRVVTPLMLDAGEGKGATATDVADLAQEAMQASVDALSAQPLPPNDPESPGRKGR